MIMNTLFLLRVTLVIVLFIIVLYVIKVYRANRKAKRISRYSIEPIVNNYSSYSDRVLYSYYRFVKKMRVYVKKSFYLKKSAKRYDKYISYKNHNVIEGIDFITTKIVIAMVFIVFTVFSQVFSLRILNFFDFVINFVIGYYILDIYLHFSYKKKKKKMANDLLRAVIVMNNAFKSGKSTLQAIKITGDELEGPLKEEFKKIYLDMKYGLSVDTVFDRFAKRVGIDEAVYLSSSLSILNKTGGNIVLVFSSIERTLFDRKKLDLELKNISSVPKMVVKVLIAVPVIFGIVIYFLDPDFFAPLFDSVLGYMIVGIIIIMFSIYIFLLMRILRIEV